MSRILSRAALLVGLLLALASGAYAQQAGEFITRAKTAILLDYESGSVVFQKQADELVAPASMSKLMTLAVLFRALKDGKITLDTPLKTSENAWRTGGAPSGTSAMFIPINTTTPVSELIQGIVVQSGNDACITVAEGLGGTVAKFADMMTAEARRIGLQKSTFANPTGLSDPKQLMTARELAVLARYLIREYPEHFPVFGQREFNYRKHRFINRNPLLGEAGVDGMKTGHTKDAGYGMVVTARVGEDQRRLIGVVMGLADEKERKTDTKRLLEWGAKSIAKARLFEASETVGYARVWGGSAMYVPLQGKGAIDVVLPKFPAGQKLKGEIIYQGPLKPPVKTGSEIAILRITSTVPGHAEPLATSEVPLYATADVEPAGFSWRGIDALLVYAMSLVKL